MLHNVNSLHGVSRIIKLFELRAEVTYLNNGNKIIHADFYHLNKTCKHYNFAK